jgi:serine/threonine-protein kinase HipA
VGRPAHRRELTVWTNGTLVGTWHIPRQGSHKFTYAEEWAQSPESRSLSLSMPINLDGQPIQGPQVANYFDNLLPDSEPIRRRLQAKFKTQSRDAFDLLQAIGRECVGAVQLLTSGETPDDVFSINAQSLTEAEIEKQLVDTVNPTPYGFGNDDDGLRISIAGAQEKSAFLWHEGSWCRPHGSTPTTHIFKLPLGLVGNRQADMRTSVENEWLCAELIHDFGFPIARGEILRFGTQKVLAVKRFDRRLHTRGNYWLRLPQEDFCQVTGTPSELKYENKGGPGLLKIAQYLQGSVMRDADLRTLLGAQLLFWMLAATDGHAKNFSVHLLEESRFQLTPLYDVLSGWPVVGSGPNHFDLKEMTLAMAARGKNVHYRFAEIQRRHFNQTARRAGLGPDMENIINDIVSRTPQVVEDVRARLPVDFPQPLFISIARGLQAAADQLARQLPE